MTRPGKWLELAFEVLYYSMPVVTLLLAYISIPLLVVAPMARLVRRRA